MGTDIDICYGLSKTVTRKMAQLKKIVETTNHDTRKFDSRLKMKISPYNQIHYGIQRTIIFSRFIY